MVASKDAPQIHSVGKGDLTFLIVFVQFFLSFNHEVGEEEARKRGRHEADQPRLDLVFVVPSSRDGPLGQLT